MVDLNRRSFLGGMLAVAGAAAITKALPFDNAPRIWGDGIHDDTAGLQACFDGKPFVCEDGAGVHRIVQGENTEIILSRGIYRLTGAIFPRGNTALIGCELRGDPGVETLINMQKDSHDCLIQDCMLRSGGNAGPILNVESSRSMVDGCVGINSDKHIFYQSIQNK